MYVRRLALMFIVCTVPADTRYAAAVSPSASATPRGYRDSQVQANTAVNGKWGSSHAGGAAKSPSSTSAQLNTEPAFVMDEHICLSTAFSPSLKPSDCRISLDCGFYLLFLESNL